jgi:general secretion pathway protein G
MRFLISKKRGFTMVELLVAVAIVSLLGAVVLGTLQAGRMKARDSQRISDLGQIQVALRLYRDAYSVGHPNSAGEALTSNSTTGALIASNLASFPMDPSGTSYYYANAYSCNGVSRPVLIALAMERANAGNFVSTCGATYTTITTGVTPTANSYVVILK